MSLLEKLKEEVITDPLLQKQYETEKEIYNIAKCLKICTDTIEYLFKMQ